MLNHIVLMGRLTRDPELRYTQNNTPVVNFTIAVERDYAGKLKEERKTDFIDVISWRHTAEFVSRFFSKGKMAIISGKLQIRLWTDKQGNNHKAAEVVADNVYFGDSKKDQTITGASNGSVSDDILTFNNDKLPFEDISDINEDLPF